MLVQSSQTLVQKPTNIPTIPILFSSPGRYTKYILKVQLRLTCNFYERLGYLVNGVVYKLPYVITIVCLGILNTTPNTPGVFYFKVWLSSSSYLTPLLVVLRGLGFVLSVDVVDQLPVDCLDVPIFCITSWYGHQYCYFDLFSRIVGFVSFDKWYSVHGVKSDLGKHMCSQY